MPKTKSFPRYSLHKPSGQARVRIEGKDHYLGEYGSPCSEAAYDRLKMEWHYRRGVTGAVCTVDDLAIKLR